MTSSSPIVVERRETAGHWNAPREGEIEGDHHFEARDPRAASVFPVRSRRKLSRRKLGSSNMLMSGAPQTNRWSGSDSAFSQPPGWHYDRVGWSDTRQTMTHKEG